jgi:hypothetical protein
MAADIYVMGTSHPLQCGRADVPKSSVASYETELRTALDKYKIKRVAEEMSPDGLKEHDVSETVAQRVANELGLPYQAVDLTKEDRAGLSLDDSTLLQVMRSFKIQDGGPLRQGFDDLADGIRERLWIARILSREHWPVFLICGSEHAVSLRRLWRCMGFATKLVHLDYEP